MEGSASDASKAVTGADVIIFCVPTFAHQYYFEAIAPHVTPHTAIIGLPGNPGFEFHCLHVLKEKVNRCVILNYESLPWTCRVAEIGRKVTVLRTKEELRGSKWKACVGSQQTRGDPALLLQTLLGELPVLKEAPCCLEMAFTAFPHPCLMYGAWRDWDGVPLSQPPLFYQVRKEGLVHPMREMSPGQFVPDFQHRYLSEDVPFSLAVVKGMAKIAGVATPCIDQVLTWAQGHLGKEFIVGSELKGKDVKDTRAPQAFGLNTLDDLSGVVAM
ncbi:hypothetical protein ACOMHN_047246 [Nucella lapillus]